MVSYELLLQQLHFRWDLIVQVLGRLFIGGHHQIWNHTFKTGRGGRDGKTAYASLLYSKRDIAQYYVEDTMKHYCENSTLCRRSLLFS